MESHSALCCSQAQKATLSPCQLDSPRRKLWDLGHHYFCSVLGTCLPSNELRVLARKSGVPDIKNLSDYDLHRIATNQAAEKTSRLAKLMQNYLEKQAREAVQHSDGMSAQELTQHWKEVFKSGNKVGACYWAFLTHPLTSESMATTAFADVHMRSHLADRQTTEFHREISTLKRKLQSSEDKSLSRQAAISDLKKQTKDLRLELKSVSSRALQSEQLEEITRFKVEIECLREKLDAESAKRIAVDREFRLLQVTHNLLQDKFAESEKKLQTKVVAPYCTENQNQDSALDSSNSQCTETLDDPDLAGRCIVYVGGRTRQCGRFKNIVLKRNGKFLHHDGGLEDTNRLDSVLAKADAVMCPLDCVSHNAMNKARKHCKLQGKPLIMLDKSSLTAFSQGLEQVCLQ